MRARVKPRHAGRSCNVGETHPNSKLTEELVREIRSSKERGSDIARRLGVTRAAVSAVRRGVSWRHVSKRPEPVEATTEALVGSGGRLDGVVRLDRGAEHDRDGAVL